MLLGELARLQLIAPGERTCLGVATETQGLGGKKEGMGGKHKMRSDPRDLDKIR